MWVTSIGIRTEPTGNFRDYEWDNDTIVSRTHCTPSGTRLYVSLPTTAKRVIGNGERRVVHLEEVNAL